MNEKKEKKKNPQEKTSRNQTTKLRSPPCKILETILKVDQRRTLTNRQENKKTHDDAPDLISQRWHRQTGCVKKRRRKLVETKLQSRNFIKGLNTWTVLLVRNSGPFLKWTREELQQMDRKTKNSWTMRPYVVGQYMSRNEGRGVTIEDSVDELIQRQECNIIAEGFRFTPLGLVRLRTFRLSAWVT